MTGNVTFDFGDTDAAGRALIVPASAVAEDDQGRFVFLLTAAEEETARVEKRYVTVGQLTSEGFEIESGLTAGERIATAGLQTLLEGQQVRLR